jgi:sortase (surface protein transpeptidase)
MATIFAKFLNLGQFVAVKATAVVLAVALLGAVGLSAILPASAAEETAVAEAEQAEVIEEQSTEEPAEEPVEEPVKEATVVAAARPAPSRPAPAPAPVDPSQATYINIGGIISSPITSVGLTAGGAVDVPGSTVGWWNGSARIGQPGASFLDGHTPGILGSLSAVGVGANIAVTMGDGSVISYRVVDRVVYDYDYVNPGSSANYNIMAAALSSRGGSDGLNIMTCHGVFVGGYGTYSQRLVVFAARI